MGKVQASHPLTKSLTKQAGSGPGEAKCENCLPKGQAGIDLFTETAAILNLSDLRSIMGCLGSMSTMIRYTRSVFTSAFRDNYALSFP